MTWKVIASSVIGTTHIESNTSCEDAFNYTIINNNGNEVVIACICDGAGSAAYAKEAAQLVTTLTIDTITAFIAKGTLISKALLIDVIESIHDELRLLSLKQDKPFEDFACTFLCAVLFNNQSIFMQIGDGVIIQEDHNNGYAAIWWPDNGEYINSTFFITDDDYLSHLKITIIHHPINEMAILTDGLQSLVLNSETSSVHQPFCWNLFKWLRMATSTDEVTILQGKLEEYLNSDTINTRTNDDKTLFLATRISSTDD